MNKFTILAVLMLAMPLFVRAGDFIIEGEPIQAFTLSREEAQNETYHRIRVKMQLNEHLSLLETATTICFETADTFEVLNGESSAFGMQFLCAISECTSNTHLHTLLFGSHATTEGKWAGSGYDASFTNRGVVELNDGRHPDTVFEIGDDIIANVHLPPTETTTDMHYKCFTSYKGTYSDHNLLIDVDLTGWEEHEITIHGNTSP